VRLASHTHASEGLHKVVDHSKAVPAYDVAESGCSISSNREGVRLCCRVDAGPNGRGSVQRPPEVVKTFCKRLAMSVGLKAMIVWVDGRIATPAKP
jgi:hypothetical protein